MAQSDEFNLLTPVHTVALDQGAWPASDWEQNVSVTQEEIVHEPQWTQHNHQVRV